MNRSNRTETRRQAGSPRREWTAAQPAGTAFLAALFLAAIAAPAAAHTRITTDITWSEDIRQILRQHCMRCHSPGGIAPDYADFTIYGTDAKPGARAWATAIEEEVLTGRMPPWDADRRYGDFSNARTLTPDEVSKITAWVNGGAPQGPRRDLPAPPEFTDPWILGEPGLVVEPAEDHVLAGGQLSDSYHVEIPVEVPEKTWITGYEFRPDNPHVVQRMTAWIVDPPGDPETVEVEIQVPYDPFAPDRQKPPTRQYPISRGRRFLGQWLRGDAPVLLPFGTGKRLYPGSKIELLVDYQRHAKEGTDQAIADRPRLGLHLAKTKDEVDLITESLHLGSDALPLDKKVAKKGAEEAFTFDESVRLLSLSPHLGADVANLEVRAVYPDGRGKTLLYLPEYRPDWPASYVFESPLDMPKGTRVEMVGGFGEGDGKATTATFELYADYSVDDHIALPNLPPAPTPADTSSGGMLIGALGSDVKLGPAAPGAAPAAAGAASATDPNAGAHMDHSPLHGGQFFMAPNQYHHLEGTLSEPGVFRIYVYDDFKQPVDPRNFAAKVVFERYDDKSGEFSEEEYPMAPVAGTSYLQGDISKEMPAEFYASVWLGGEAFRFDFYFEELTKDQPPPPRPQLAAIGQHSHVRPPLNIPADAVGIVRELGRRSQQVEEKIDGGDWLKLYVPAFDGRDLAEALLNHTDTISGRDLGRLRLAVGRVMQSAAELDRAGDLGDAGRARKALERFNEGVDELVSVIKPR